ncbi:glycosyltransferase [Evansella clarkii]|uniref:glycosyltransferase n=1 Tax=Evansella clarkii TaxID=79879 RepID=UPI001FD14C32|nr:glycosyltransferase [Evansella clarkii]
MNKKKVLFMLTSMNIGGVEKSLLSLLSVIPKEKYEITILLLEKKGGFLNDIPDWVKVEEAAWFKKIKPVIMQPPQKTIADQLKKKEFLSVPAFAATYFLSKKMDNRYLYYSYVLKNVPENSYEYDAAISYQGPTDVIDFYVANKVKAAKKISWVHFDVSKHRVNEKLYTTLYKRFDKIFVVSKTAKEKICEKFSETRPKIEVFKNMISHELVNELSKEEVDFDNNFSGLRIVTVGRLSFEKGQMLAIEVLKKLKSEGHNVRWYCIGEGNNRSEYEKLIVQYDLINDFKLLGAKKNPYPFISKADIYVQPSMHEGYCMTLMEAKMLKKPIITTNFTGAKEQIKDEYNGYIINYNRVELYEKIKYLIENPEIRKNLTINLNKSVNSQE